jgi:hypothetical protein
MKKKTKRTGTEESKMATELGKKKKSSVKKILSSVLSPSAKTAKVEAPPTWIGIDHPVAGETLQPTHYAVRIGSVGGWGIELSIDGGAWLPCRQAGGYHWYDWWPAPGKHQLAARMKLGDGKVLESKTVSCKVS